MWGGARYGEMMGKTAAGRTSRRNNMSFTIDRYYQAQRQGNESTWVRQDGIKYAEMQTLQNQTTLTDDKPASRIYASTKSWAMKVR